MMKKRALIVSILLVVLLFVVSGCGKSGETGNKMLEDLRLQSDVTEWNGLTFELTECEILTQTPQGETQCVYECKILKENEEYEIETKKYIISGWLLLFMNLALVVIVFFMVYWHRTFYHHMITTIAMALYTFITFTFLTKVRVLFAAND